MRQIGKWGTQCGYWGSLAQMRKLGPRREEGTCPDCTARQHQNQGAGRTSWQLPRPSVMKNLRLEGDEPGPRSHCPPAGQGRALQPVPALREARRLKVPKPQALPSWHRPGGYSRV